MDFGQKILFRERVNREMQGILTHFLTIVSAPMGYGKTTAVRIFLEQQGIEPVWVQFVAGDGSAAYFWDRFTAKLEIKNSGFGQMLRNHGFPNDAPGRAKILDLICDAEIPEPLVIVLDDFHLVKDPDVFKLITLIVKQMVKNLHIVIVARDINALDIYDFAPLCANVTLEKLRFLQSEVSEYFNMMGMQTNENIIQEVTEHTEGWIAMIYLVLLGIQNGQSPRDVESVSELVEYNLYAGFDDETRDVLQRLSLMDFFTAEQAGYVLEREDMDVVLRLMRKRNAFLAYNEAEKRYTIHNVLLDFLRGRKGLPVETGKRIYRRIAEWQLKHEEYISAFIYFDKADESEAVFSILNDYNRPTLWYPLFFMVRGIFDKQPREVWIRYPFAFIHCAQMLLVSGDPASMEKGMEMLNVIKRHYESDTGNNYRRVVLGDIEVCHIFMNIKNLDRMIYHVERASELYEDNNSVLLSRDKLITFALPHFIYAHYHKPGELKEVSVKFGASTNVYACYTDGGGKGGDYLCEAEHALETMDLQRAELAAYKALHKAKAYDQICIAACAYFVLARINMYNGNVKEAVEILSRINAEVTPNLNTTADLIAGYIYAVLGQPDKIPEWMNTDTLPYVIMMYGGMGWIQLVYGKTLLSKGDFIKADMLCESFEPNFHTFNNMLGLLHNHIHRAAAKAESESEAAGIPELKKALIIGQADDIILPFAENHRYILPILDAMRKTEHDIDTPYLERVIESCMQYRKNNPERKKLDIKLSEREREILELMANGLSRDEIAAKLIVSVSTVKRHMENIYLKLEVNNKTKAIKKASEIGII